METPTARFTEHVATPEPVVVAEQRLALAPEPMLKVITMLAIPRPVALEVKVAVNVTTVDVPDTMVVVLETVSVVAALLTVREPAS
jgi:hypothetical protein